MQGHEVEREARHRLPSLLASLLEAPAIEAESSDRAYDVLLEAGGRRWLVEVKSSSRPGVVAAAAEQLTQYASRSPLRGVSLLVVPYMTAAGAKTAAQRGVNWVDLSGNAQIRDGELYVRVEGRPNQFPPRGRPASAFAPKSARIARLLLLDPWRWWRQKDLASMTGLDDGHLSRVVRRLDDDDLLEHRAAEFRARDPEVMLDAWADGYRFDRHDIVAAHVTGTGSELASELHQRLAAAGVDHAFTGLPAAWALAHHARFRLVSVYVHGDPRASLDAARLRSGERGANVQLIGPNDDGVFAGGRDLDDLPCVSAPQAYLDLLHLPERAREAAEQLRGDGLLWKPRD
jgi:hypothetical protein